MSDELKYMFEVINIKLQTTKTGEDKKNAYIKLITDLVDRKIHSAVAENKHAILYSYKRKNTATQIEYLHGKLGKGFYFENESGNSINLQELKSERVDNDTSRIFEAIVTDYVFIPEAHRFCIKTAPNLKGRDAFKFLKNALNEVKDKEDVLIVNIENEPKAIDEILTASKIHKIDYVISYTNDDFLESAANSFDRRLKRSQIGKIEIKAQSDHNDFMNTKDEELLEGGIELARSNGTIKSAIITDKEGTKKQITSTDKPLQIEYKTTIEKFRDKIVNKIMRTFRTPLS